MRGNSFGRKSKGGDWGLPNKPPDEEGWIPFDGNYEEIEAPASSETLKPILTDEGLLYTSVEAEDLSEAMMLTPFADREIRLFFEKKDILVDNAVAFVRHGAQALRIQIPKESSWKMAENRGALSVVPCQGHPSMCLGKLEICCHDFTVIRSCQGYWRCP